MFISVYNEINRKAHQIIGEFKRAELDKARKSKRDIHHDDASGLACRQFGDHVLISQLVKLNQAQKYLFSGLLFFQGTIDNKQTTKYHTVKEKNGKDN